MARLKKVGLFSVFFFFHEENAVSLAGESGCFDRIDEPVSQRALTAITVKERLVSLCR